MAFILAGLGVLGTLAAAATNVLLFARVLRGQADVQVQVNSHLAWYVARTEQLHSQLASHGITPAAPATKPGSVAGDTIAP